MTIVTPATDYTEHDTIINDFDLQYHLEYLRQYGALRNIGAPANVLKYWSKLVAHRHSGRPEIWQAFEECCLAFADMRGVGNKQGKFPIRCITMNISWGFTQVFDANGRIISGRERSITHNVEPLMARWIVWEHPELRNRIDLHRSIFDGIEPELLKYPTARIYIPSSTIA